MSTTMSDDLRIILGQRVRARRDKLGWTQKDLADKLGWHQPDISDLEQGHHSPNIDTVAKLAKVLKVAPSDLLD